MKSFIYGSEHLLNDNNIRKACCELDLAHIHRPLKTAYLPDEISGIFPIHNRFNVEVLN